MLVGIAWLHTLGSGHFLWHSALHSDMMQTDPSTQLQNNFSQWNQKYKDVEVPALPQNLFGENLWFRA